MNPTISTTPGRRGARPALVGRRGVRVLASPIVASCVALVAASCNDSTPIPPVVPGHIRYTPIAVTGTERVPPTETPGPSPTATQAPTRVVPPPEPLSADRHFGVSVFAEDLGPVRFMAYSPTGDLFVTVPPHDRILVLPDEDRDGVSDRTLIYAEGEGLNYPHGIAFRPGWLYVANTDSIVRIPYERGDLKAQGAAEFLVPLPGGPQHRTRTIVFGPDRRMYVSVGSSCNVCIEDDERRAAVLRFEVDGGGAALFATGLRNAVGLAFNPTTGELWATENGRDGMGDDLPPDELNRLVGGGNYGWPYCYGNQLRDPDMPSDESLCAATIPPAVQFQAHSAPLGMTFYTGTQFPKEYQGDLFIAYHGSWDRSIPTGYSLIRVPFEDGYPSGPALGFVQGWLRPDTRRWGRPVDIVVAPDGSLLVSDDAAERIYRVYYAAPRVAPTRMR